MAGGSKSSYRTAYTIIPLDDLVSVCTAGGMSWSGKCTIRRNRVRCELCVIIALCPLL